MIFYLILLIPKSALLQNFKHFKGKKKYETFNHLGNVLGTVSDRKLAVDDGSINATGITDFYAADILDYQDYYAFGAIMPERNDGNYRFGFQGQEQDDEVKGKGNSVNYTFRMHDPRLGRFFVVDPLNSKYPNESPYNFTSNQPISFIESDGRDNYIYLVVLNSSKPSLKKQDISNIISQTNQNFEKLGLETRVKKVIPDNFDFKSIDKTDAIAILGSKTEVINYTTCINGCFSNQLRGQWEGGGSNPELSQNDDSPVGGNIIAIDAFGIEDFSKKIGLGDEQNFLEKGGALIIMHGAGHNAGLAHSDDDRDPNSTSNIMNSGNETSHILSSNKNIYRKYSDYVGNDKDILGYKGNNDYVKTMKERFGTNPAADNRKKDNK